MTGTATVTASGGTGNYFYSWSTVPEQTTATATGLSVGSYTVTVTDENNCTVTAEVIIQTLDSPTATTSKVDPTCGLDNGSITFIFPDHPDRTGIEFSIDGGLNYTNNISDNLGTYTFDNLDAGTYNLWARWGEDDCPTEIGTETLTDQLGLK